MLRSVVSRVGAAVTASTRITLQRACAVNSVRFSHGNVETDQEFDDRFVNFFNNPNIDGWAVRRGITELHGYDLVPEPRIVISALQACRRINDHSLAVRFLEALKYKCGDLESTIWPYMMQEVKPTMDELGIASLEELGYDKPELACVDNEDIH